ncbi:MAG: type II secretion system protein GspD [Fibrobacter sp.]|jgi:type IV pilus assembly protein PilQ|nr:type II secretion system protein GspD [Fibrobacter sp.]
MLSRFFLFILFFSLLHAEPLSLDFVETDIKEVLRAISMGYNVPILVDKDVSAKVTIHLDSVELLEALTAIASINDLALVKEATHYRFQNKINDENYHFELKDSLVYIEIHNKDIQDFIKDYSWNTGVNLLIDPTLDAKISARLEGLSIRRTLEVILRAHGFKLWDKGDYYSVEKLQNNIKQENLSMDISYRDSLFYVQLKDAPLKDVLYEISNLVGFNLVLYGDIKESVYLKADSLPLKKLFQLLFKGSRYAYMDLEANNILVGEKLNHNAISEERFYFFKHIQSEKGLSLLAKAYPDKGLQLLEIKEQNGLFLVGAWKHLEAAIEFLQKIDVEPLQVLLECVIVEFNKGKLFEMGLNSGRGKKSSEGVVGLNSFIRTSGKNKRLNFGEIGILSDYFEFELSALEENNLAEILARPSITTLNGNKASIHLTNTSYYMVNQVSPDGYPITDYHSFNEGVSLEITPSVAKEGSISIEIIPEIKTSSRSSGDGPRDISTRNLKTTVSLKDGETFCLGGLIRQNSAKVRSAIPFLGSLPWIGALFSYHTTENYSMELGIFITPRVIRSQKGNNL